MLMLMLKRKMDARKKQAAGIQKQKKKKTKNITMVNRPRDDHTLFQPVAACQLNLGRTNGGSPGNDI